MIFERVNGTWTFPADPAVTIDQSKFESILNALADLKVSRYVAFDDKKAEDFDLIKPYFTITASSGKESWTLDIGKELPGSLNRYAKTSVRTWIFEITSDDVKKINISLKELAKTSGSEVPSGQNESAY